MVRAVFTPEAELTLFLRMRTKEIVKTYRKCIPTEDPRVTGNRGRRSEGRGQIFDRKLVNRRFCARAVKIGQNSLIVLSNRRKFCPFMGNRSR